MNKPRVEYFQSPDGLWYWRFRAANGRVVADGAQGYRELRSAWKGFASIAGAIYSDAAGEVVIES